MCVCVCAPASYLPQLAGGCVALGTSTSSGAGGPWYNYQGGYHRHGQWPPVAPYPFVHLCVCVCVRACACTCACVCVNACLHACVTCLWVGCEMWWGSSCVHICYVATIVTLNLWSISILDEIPSLEGAAKQINILKDELGLEYVYLSTDAPFTGRVRYSCTVEPRLTATPE